MWALLKNRQTQSISQLVALNSAMLLKKRILTQWKGAQKYAAKVGRII